MRHVTPMPWGLIVLFLLMAGGIGIAALVQRNRRARENARWEVDTTVKPHATIVRLVLKADTWPTSTILSWQASSWITPDDPHYKSKLRIALVNARIALEQVNQGNHE